LSSLEDFRSQLNNSNLFGDGKQDSVKELIELEEDFLREQRSVLKGGFTTNIKDPTKEKYQEIIEEIRQFIDYWGSNKRVKEVLRDEKLKIDKIKDRIRPWRSNKKKRNRERDLRRFRRAINILGSRAD